MSLTLLWLINWGVASSFLANLATLLIIFRIRSCNGSYKTPRVSRQQATTFRCTTHALIPRWGIWRLPNVCLSYGQGIWLQRLNRWLRNTSDSRNTLSSNFSSIHLQPYSSFGLVARKKIRHVQLDKIPPCLLKLEQRRHLLRETLRCSWQPAIQH